MSATSRIALALGLVCTSSGCAAVERYSVRAAENSCEAVSVCTVYGPNGETLSPCTYWGKMTIYPGDPRWPYTTPGVCDAVQDGRVISTREQHTPPRSPTGPYVGVGASGAIVAPVR
ncbi:MAG TPA: hypothetical protein VFD92_08780 [Candidatus Binatia bacterium]|nr:hypothetical protein [Candidatus Binatia bacterium]